ncbi:MAG TPA: DUF3524 domain-containing protein, partial [Gammaproteobacteria bacterium]|nr:DUF3524 domain-containing protein [Gammaproteobacteria bacterium]
VLGSPPPRPPAIFPEARRRLGDRVVHFGHVPDRAAYARWLWAADVLPVTSRHDFFGISVLEAVYCRTFPLLPHDLAYPELIPEAWRERCLYSDVEDLENRLRTIITADPPPRWDLNGLWAAAAGYAWERMAPVYDRILEGLG